MKMLILLILIFGRYHASAPILYIDTEAKTFQYNGHFYIVHNSIKFLNHSLSLTECNQKYGASFLSFNTEDEYIKSMKALSSIYIANALPELTWIGGFTDEAKSATLGYSSYKSENGTNVVSLQFKNDELKLVSKTSSLKRKMQVCEIVQDTTFSHNIIVSPEIDTDVLFDRNTHTCLNVINLFNNTNSINSIFSHFGKLSVDTNYSLLQYMELIVATNVANTCNSINLLFTQFKSDVTENCTKLSKCQVLENAAATTAECRLRCQCPQQKCELAVVSSLNGGHHGSICEITLITSY